MSDLNFILAYVESVPKSTALYGKLLGLKPVESSDNFAMFVLPSGVRLGLWAWHDVQPAANAPGGIELCFPVRSDDALKALLKEWTGHGLTVIQQPTRMDFGHTFTATDPDGHRLRAFVPAEIAVQSRAALEAAS
jgi:catechol 2,3-dioxygenase-like lactoylglutathione lyase family enzyme